MKRKLKQNIYLLARDFIFEEMDVFAFLGFSRIEAYPMFHGSYNTLAVRIFPS